MVRKFVGLMLLFILVLVRLLVWLGEVLFEIFVKLIGLFVVMIVLYSVVVLLNFERLKDFCIYNFFVICVYNKLIYNFNYIFVIILGIFDGGVLLRGLCRLGKRCVCCVICKYLFVWEIRMFGFI